MRRRLPAVAPRVIAAIRHSAVLAAALSFVWPGLGQGWAGARRRALLFAVPMMLLAAGGVLVLIVQGRARAFGLLLQPSVLLALLALNVVVLAYRLLAIVDAYRVATSALAAPPARGQTAIAAVLLGVVLGGTLLMHGWLGLVGFKTYDTVAAVFHTAEPTPTPSPTATPAAGRDARPDPGADPDPHARAGLVGQRAARPAADRRRRGPGALEPAHRHHDPAERRYRHRASRDVRDPAQHVQRAASGGPRPGLRLPLLPRAPERAVRLRHGPPRDLPGSR